MSMQGFVLQDADVDELLRVAKEVEGSQVYADPSLPPEQTADLLVRTVRLLQVALDVQFQENEQLITDYNTMRDDFQVGYHGMEPRGQQSRRKQQTDTCRPAACHSRYIIITRDGTSWP